MFLLKNKNPKNVLGSSANHINYLLPVRISVQQARKTFTSNYSHHSLRNFKTGFASSCLYL
jgi:hypothetical protein